MGRVGRVDREASRGELADADTVHVGGEVPTAVGPATDDPVNQDRRGLELHAAGVADGSVLVVEVDDGGRAGRPDELLGDEVDRADVDARTTLVRRPVVVGTLVEDEAADPLDVGGVGLVGDVEPATAQVQVDVVGQAVVLFVIAVVLEGELAVVDVHARDARKRAVILDEDRAAVDREATREGVRVTQDDAAGAGLQEVDGPGDRAAVAQVTGVDLVDGERGGGRGGIRHVASGARPFQGAGAGEGEEGLGVTAEVERRARVDDHRGRHGQRVGTPVEHHIAGLDRGPARSAGELLGVEVQRAVQALVPAGRRIEGGTVDVERGTRGDHEARDRRVGVQQHARAEGGIAGGQDHARTGEVQRVETRERAHGGIGELERVDLGVRRQLHIGQLVEEGRGRGRLQRAGGDVGAVAEEAGGRGEGAGRGVAGEVGARLVGHDRARDEPVGERRSAGEDEAVLLGAEGITRRARGEEREVVGIAAETLEDEGRAGRGGVDLDDRVAGRGGEVVRQVVLGDELGGVARVTEAAAEKLDAGVAAETAGDGLGGVVEPEGRALVVRGPGAVGAAHHAGTGDLEGAGVVIEALLADVEQAIGRLDVEGARAEMLDLVVIEAATVGGAETRAGDGDIAAAADLETLGGRQVDATREDQVAGDGTDGGVVVDVDDAGDRVGPGGVGELAGVLDAAPDHVAAGREVEVLREGDAARELEGGIDAAADGHGVVAGAQGRGVGGDDDALLDGQGAEPVRVGGGEDERTDVLLREVRRRAAGEGRVDGQGLAGDHLHPGVTQEAERTVGRPGIHRAETRATAGGKQNLVGGITEGGVGVRGEVALAVRDQVAREGIGRVGQDHGAVAVLDDVTRTRDGAGERESLDRVGSVGGVEDREAHAAVQRDRSGELEAEGVVVGEPDGLSAERDRGCEGDGLVDRADRLEVRILGLDPEVVVGVARGDDRARGDDALRVGGIVAEGMQDEVAALVERDGVVVERLGIEEQVAARLVEHLPVTGPRACVPVEDQRTAADLADVGGTADRAMELEGAAVGEEDAIRTLEGDRSRQGQVARTAELEVALDDHRVGHGALDVARLATVVLGEGLGRIERRVEARRLDGQGAGAERAGEDVVVGIDDGVGAEGQGAFGEGDAAGERARGGRGEGGLGAGRHEGQGAGGEGAGADIQGTAVDAGGGGDREGRGAAEGDRAAGDIEGAGEGVGAGEDELAGAELGEAARAGHGGRDGQRSGVDRDDRLLGAEIEGAAGNRDAGGVGRKDGAGSDGQGIAGLGDGVGGRGAEAQGVDRKVAGLGGGGDEGDVVAGSQRRGEFVGGIERAEAAGGRVGDESAGRAARGAQAAGREGRLTEEVGDDLGVLGGGVEAGGQRVRRADQGRRRGEEDAADRGRGGGVATQVDAVDEGHATVGADEVVDGQGGGVGRVELRGDRAEATGEGQGADRLGRADDRGRVAGDRVGAAEEQGRASEGDRDRVGEAVDVVVAGAGVVEGERGGGHGDAGRGVDRALRTSEHQAAGGDVGRSSVGVGVGERQGVGTREHQVAGAADHAGERQGVIALERGAGRDGDIRADGHGGAADRETTAREDDVAREQLGGGIGPHREGAARVDGDRTRALDERALGTELALVNDDVAVGDHVAAQPGLAEVDLGQGEAVEVEEARDIRAEITADGRVAREDETGADAAVDGAVLGGGVGGEAVDTGAGHVDDTAVARGRACLVEGRTGGEIRRANPATEAAVVAGEDAALVDEQVTREGVGVVQVDAAAPGDGQVPCPADDAGLAQERAGDAEGGRAVDGDAAAQPEVDRIGKVEGRAAAEGDGAGAVGQRGGGGDQLAVGHVDRAGEGRAVDVGERDGAGTGDGERAGRGVVHQGARNRQRIRRGSGADDELAAGGQRGDVAPGEGRGVAAGDGETGEAERTVRPDGDGVGGGGGAGEFEGVDGAAVGERQGRGRDDVAGRQGPDGEVGADVAVERTAQRDDLGDAIDHGDGAAGGDAETGDVLADG